MRKQSNEYQQTELLNMRKPTNEYNEYNEFYTRYILPRCEPLKNDSRISLEIKKKYAELLALEIYSNKLCKSLNYHTSMVACRRAMGFSR